MTPKEAYRKARIAEKRLPELEHIIMTESFSSFRYAQNVIKGRWVEAEDFIMTKSNSLLLYAQYVIKGKLPDKMHNMMILHAIKDPDDYCAKEYFRLIK